MDFLNKVVLITGASSGIGATLAVHFAKLSAKLALVGRNEKNLKEIAQICEQAKKIKPLTIIADLSNDGQAKAIVPKTIQHWGQLDVLVNCAGFGSHKTILSKDLIQEFDHVLATNLRAVVLLTSEAVPHLIKTKGNIVNISSVASLMQIPGFLTYGVAKAGVDQFTKCVALELAAKGVRVNAINPGATKTKFLQAVGLNEQQADEFYKKQAQAVPLKRVTESEEVAEMAVYLASDRARSITGSVHVIDCGASLHSILTWPDELK